MNGRDYYTRHAAHAEHPFVQGEATVSLSIPNSMPTVGEIARRLNEPVHRVEYVLRTRDIQPAGVAGNARVYTDDDVKRIAAELADIDDRQRRQEVERGC
jgi:hypothetical protein